MTPRIAVTTGEAAGIGPDLCLALVNYAGVHKGRLPDVHGHDEEEEHAHHAAPDDHDHGHDHSDSPHIDADSWVFSLAPFLENVDSVRACPDDPEGDYRMRNNLTSYALNGYLAVEIDLERNGRIHRN